MHSTAGLPKQDLNKDDSNGHANMEVRSLPSPRQRTTGKEGMLELEKTVFPGRVLQLVTQHHVVGPELKLSQTYRLYLYN